jgi:hypothetical protein
MEEVEFDEEAAQPHAFFCGMGEGHIFSLSGGKGNKFLLS